MAFLVTFLRWLVIVLPVLVLVVDPYVAAYGLSLASFVQRPRGRVLGAPRVGLCESSILPYGGYECQEYKVKTSDGYILGMQRVQAPGTKANLPNTKVPVILQHGVFLDGQSWFVNVRSQTLPFVLADNGYDVWIANSRGTRYSSQHDCLHPSDWKFWDWSWDELAQYDLPACVNYVYAQTQQKPHYIGHSQGTIIALAAFSEGKVYDKLRSASLLSPVAYLQHMTTLIGRVFARNFLGDLGFSMGLAEFDLQKFQLQHFVRSLCSLNNIDCYDALTIFTGNNCCLNSSTIEEWLKGFPQPTSMKNMAHFSQTFHSGVFAKYDYGSLFANLKHYWHVSPSQYNLNNIPKSFPLFISHGSRDALSDPKDVNLLMDHLKSHDRDKLTYQFVKDYAHMDFIIGMSANDVVWNPMMAFLKRH